MGQSLYRLEVIKKRFVKSTAHELDNFFTFLENQISCDDPYDHESKYTIYVDAKLIGKVQADVSGVSPQDLETLLMFIEERIDLCRLSDKADKIIGDLEREEFYSREEMYTEIENYILKLKLG
ncbi:MAG: hypothetical protein ACOYXT_12635 [Bacteroidota bacterium]